jgi:hypothetical protein
MTAFNVVRFRVLPGNEQAFIEHHRTMRPHMKGFLGGNLIRTGDQSFCMVGEWRSFQSIVDARPQMKALLDTMRHMLEDLGGDLGVTDPVSGNVALKIALPRPAKAKAKAKAKASKPRKKAAAAKTKSAKPAKTKRTAAKKTARRRRSS